MKQLSGQDNASLVRDQGNVFNPVGILPVHDTTTAPDGKVRYKGILWDFEERLHLHPVFSSCLGPLREERIVAARRDGRRVFYSLANAGAASIPETLHGLYCVEH